MLMTDPVYSANRLEISGETDAKAEMERYAGGEACGMTEPDGSAREGAGMDASSGKKPTILAVDDKPELLAGIADILEDEFQVIAVTNGSAALKAIEKHTPALFILDIEMPQMSGYELAKVVRGNKRFESSPIIFLTGKNTRDDVIKAIKNGGNDYLLKPVERDLLLAKIRKHL